jgi:hypothetical protein
MGTKHAGILEDALRTPPLGGTVCPDPAYVAGRVLVLQGPQPFLGALWVFTAIYAGQAASPPAVVPPPPAGEGAIPFMDLQATTYEFPASTEESEGSTSFVDDTAT